MVRFAELQATRVANTSHYASEAWRRIRQHRLDHDNHTCQGCGITAAQLLELGWPSLQVHHKNAGPPDYRYPSFGNEQLHDLLTLCSECHDGITDSVRRQRFKLDPRKKVKPVHVSTPSLTLPTPNGKPSISSDHLDWREPIVVPQRANRRPAQPLRKSHEGD